MEKYFCYGKKDFCTSLRCDRECPHYDGSGGDYLDAPPTNAERIRAMSDEELANLLTDYSNNDGWVTEIGRKICYERIFKWLQYTAEEDDHA